MTEPSAPPNTVSRLIYLAAKYRPTIPRAFRRFIPHIDLLDDIGKFGLEGVQVNTGTELGSLQDYYRHGLEMSEDPGSADEFRLRIASLVDNALTYEFRDEYTLTERARLFKAMDDYLLGNDLELVGKAEASLKGDTAETEGIIKWQTGFTPYDLSLGDGVYQGLHILMGNPGTGKTSALLALMAAMRQGNKATSLWYFSLETPLEMVRWRMTPLRQRTKFLEDDRIIAGITPVTEILERIRENPDPGRVILFDGPDVLTGGSTDGRRFALEDAYRELVQVKQACRAVFVPSQPRRGEQQGLSLESVAESWAKAWYSDTVTGIEMIGGESITGGTRLVMSNFKNRFGRMGKRIYFNVDWENFTWQINEGPDFPDRIGGPPATTGEGEF